MFVYKWVVVSNFLSSLCCFGLHSFRDLDLVLLHGFVLLDAYSATYPDSCHLCYVTLHVFYFIRRGLYKMLTTSPLWLDLMKRLGWAVNVVYSVTHIILIFRLYQIHMLLKIDAGRLSSSVSMIS